MSNFTVCLTHDVDRVKKTFQYITHDLRKLRIRRLGSFFNKNEPYWMFPKIMEIEDKYRVRSTFFFLEETLSPKIFSLESWKLGFGRYSFLDPKIGSIIHKLDSNGWEIGLHGSYESYRNLSLLIKEKNSLEKILGKKVVGIRQHYLNLDIPKTWILQRKAGFKYDATFGNKSDIGFREDIFHPFLDKESQILVIPLAVMEVYLFNFFSGNVNKIWEYCLSLIEKSEKESAVLSVLWHQRFFNEKEYPFFANIYEKIINECINRGATFKTCFQVYNDWVNT